MRQAVDLMAYLISCQFHVKKHVEKREIYMSTVRVHNSFPIYCNNLLVSAVCFKMKYCTILTELSNQISTLNPISCNRLYKTSGQTVHIINESRTDFPIQINNEGPGIIRDGSYMIA